MLFILVRFSAHRFCVVVKNTPFVHQNDPHSYVPRFSLLICNICVTKMLIALSRMVYYEKKRNVCFDVSFILSWISESQTKTGLAWSDSQRAKAKSSCGSCGHYHSKRLSRLSNQKDHDGNERVLYFNTPPLWIRPRHSVPHAGRNCQWCTEGGSKGRGEKWERLINATLFEVFSRENSVASTYLQNVSSSIGNLKSLRYESIKINEVHCAEKAKVFPHSDAQMEIILRSIDGMRPRDCSLLLPP